VGLTATKYLQGWGDLIKDRKISKNYLVTIIWSLSFFCAILNEWIVEYNYWEVKFSILHLLQSMVHPFSCYIIGVLIFPHEKGSESNEDYFAHFLSQKKIILGITIGLLILKFNLFEWEDPKIKTRTQVLFLLIPSIASFISNKKWVLILTGGIYFVFWMAYILGWM
jgi:hypothetical protein